MNTYRSNAIIVGVLYIIGTVSGILSLVLSAPVRDTQDLLASVAANADQLRVAALFVLPNGAVARHVFGRAVPHPEKTQ